MIVIRLLNGEAKLWQAWWFFWWIPSLILLKLSTWLPQDLMPWIVLLAILVLYAFFEILGPFAIWKCSSNCGSQVWTSIARGLIVLSPFYSVYELQSQNPNMDLNNAFVLSMLSSICIIVMYCLGKYTKSTTVIGLSDRYLTPSFLLMGRLCLFAGLFFGMS